MIVKLIDQPPKANPDFDRENPTASGSYAPYKVYNIGNNQPVKLMDFIQTIEKHLGIEAKKEFLPMQPGDVKATYADIDDLTEATDRQRLMKELNSLLNGIWGIIIITKQVSGYELNHKQFSFVSLQI